MTRSVALLGHGFAARAHANALARLPMFFPDAPSVERSVLVGRDPDRAAAAADRLGFARATTDLDGALADVDALYVAAPNDRHAAASTAALDRDVAVLCEKPLAPTVDAAERMARAADRSGAVAGTAFNYRFSPPTRAARRLISAGDLGTVRRVRAHYLQDWLVDPDAPWSWRLDADRAGSGALGDLSAHSVDLVSFLLDDRVERVAGDLQTVVDERPAPDGDGTRPVTVDDAATVRARFAGGARATLEASRVATGHRNTHRVAVEGDEGAVRFDPGQPNEMAVCRDPTDGFETVDLTDPGGPYADRWWPPGHALGWEHAVVHESAAFLDCVAAGEPFRPSFADGLAVQRVLGAVERAAAEGSWVAV
ncbi:MAG: putative dehydrogenase related protein [uncultured archaeon A07HB70]|nr:MAG: putative dehydrogenase related protein [uncultured archaeon A07HB70]